MKKKIIVIGGGIAGLTAGIYALRAGFEAEIFEKNSVAGGECTGWNRGEYYIDNCIHWLMGTTEGTALNQIWRETGALGNEIEIINSDHMYTSKLNGEFVTLWKDIERTKEELIQLSPQDEKAIDRLIEDVKKCKKVQIPAEKPAELMNPLDLMKMGKGMKETLGIMKAYEGMDTLDLMHQFKHPLIQCLISDFCTKESLAQSFLMAYGNFASGDGGIPRGGSKAMAMRMQKRFESLGGKIYTGKSAGKIEVEDGEAKAVVLQDGTKVQADYIICTCDPDYVFTQLLSPDYMDEVFKEVYSERDKYPVYGMFQAAFAVDSPVDAMKGEINLDCRDIKTDSWMNDRMTVKNFAYEPSFAPPRKQIVQVLVGLNEAAYDYWSELYKDQKQYKSKKEELANKVLKKLEREFPEYNGLMQVLDIWTPVTYKCYCNAYKGYNQAYMITKYSRKNPYPSPYIKEIDNVLLAGQWLAAPGGLPGAAIQGKFAVQRLLKKEKRSIKI